MENFNYILKHNKNVNLKDEFRVGTNHFCDLVNIIKVYKYRIYFNIKQILIKSDKELKQTKFGLKLSLSDKLRIAEANLTSTGYEYTINLENSRTSVFQESISNFVFFLA